MATVLQISDTHLRAAPNTPPDNDPPGSDPDASLLATLDAVGDVEADLLLLTGDLADDASLAAVQRLRDVVGDLAPRVMAVAGNHDGIDHVHATFGAIDSMEVGAWRVIGVETYLPGKDHGLVDVEQLIRRLDQVDDRYTLIALHHPPRSHSTNPMFQLSGADEMLAALGDRPHVRAIVSGHLHEAFDRREGDLELCGGPSSYYAIEHSGNEYRLFTDGVVGAQVLTLDDDGSFSCKRVPRSLGC